MALNGLRAHSEDIKIIISRHKPFIVCLQETHLLPITNHVTYPEFYNKWDKHEKSHWLPSEVPMHDDVE